MDLAVAIAGSVVPRWTTDRKVNVLTGSTPLRVVLETSLPCTLFCVNTARYMFVLS